MFVEDFSNVVLDNGMYLFQEKDAKKFADVAADAFYDYPLMHYFFEDDIYDDAIKCEMEATFSTCPKDIVIFADSKDINGICMAGAPFLNNVVDTSLFSGNLMKIKGHCKYKNIKRLIDFQRYCIQVKYKTIGGDCIHALYLAVKKDFQNKGIGKRLLSCVHQYADMVGKPVYLDTHKPLNVEIYKSWGYELMSSVQYEGTDTNHNALVRFPQY